VLLAVQRGNRCRRFVIARHFDEPEAFAAAGVPIANYLGAFDCAVSAEQRLEGRAIDIVAQVPHV
jgi:hypothetical protein